MSRLFLGIAVALFMAIFRLSGEPPFSGTIFLDPDIITDADASAFESLAAAGRGERLMYDRRVPGWVRLNPYLVNATYDDGLSIEIQVNPEFGSEAEALAQASRFAPVVGRMPSGLRKDVETMWIHMGTNAFGGGNNNLLIHVGQADLYEGDGILEEVFVHEAAHTSLDATHASSAGWLAAQSADPDFISTYARDNPTREDIAESYLLYLALRHRRDRISSTLADAISATIPNRIAYFDQNPINLYPLVLPPPIEILEFTYNVGDDDWALSWSSEVGATYEVMKSEELLEWELVSTVIASASASQVSLTTPESRMFYQVVKKADGS